MTIPANLALAFGARQTMKPQAMAMSAQAQTQTTTPPKAQPTAPAKPQEFAQAASKAQAQVQTQTQDQVQTQASVQAQDQTKVQTQAVQTPSTENPKLASISSTAQPDTKADMSNKPKITPAKPIQKPTVAPVDVNIAGSYHRIMCPSDEVAGLEEAAAYVNDKVREIRQAMKGRSPSNEELLVLTCLELYDQYKSVKDSERQRILEQEDSLNLIQKMLKELRATL